MAKELARHEISHNDIGEIQRGNWRKYNPYNPYVPEDEAKQVENLKVDSLDDLFDDEEFADNNDSKITSKPVVDNTPQVPAFEDLEEKVPVGVTANSNSSSTSSLEDFEDDAPVLPQDDEYDLQKELEAKFDELFGPLDE